MVSPDLGLLRDDLAAAGYTVDGVTERLGEVAARALARDQALPARRVLGRGDDPVGVLLRLFTLGDAVPDRSAAAALPSLGLERGIALGLLSRDGTSDGSVRACVDLQPHAVDDDLGEQGWWVCADLGELAHGGGVLPTDHVLGVGAASTTLVQAVVPPLRGQRCLDVGAGSGVQSLHLLRTGPTVVATDVSARACRFAQVTAALNGLELDVRQGSLFDPVPGERFDRVVANLPFVVTPRRADVPTYTYRDAGLAGDDVVRRMLLEAPAHLADGGLAQFLGNWEDRADEGWRARLDGWVHDAATALAQTTDDTLDVWVVQRELADPALYAEAWISDGGRPDRAEADSWYAAWLEDFAARDVEAVGFGMVTLRRRAADPATPPLRRLDEEHAVVPGAWRDVLAAGLTGHDALGRIDAHRDLAALLDQRPVVASGVLERRDLDPGAVDPRSVHLVDTRRRGRVVEASTALAGLVGACDGELSVAQVVGALAQLLDEPEGGLRARLLPAVRDLVAEGLLVLP